MAYIDTSAMADAVSRLARRRVSPRRLLQLADSRGIRPAKRVGRAHLWRSADARRLVPGRPGRAGWLTKSRRAKA